VGEVAPHVPLVEPRLIRPLLVSAEAIRSRQLNPANQIPVKLDLPFVYPPED
jgi:hypothetical protein